MIAQVSELVQHCLRRQGLCPAVLWPRNCGGSHVTALLGMDCRDTWVGSLPFCAGLLPFCAGAARARLSSLPTTVTLDAAALSSSLRTLPPRPAFCAACTRSSDRISFVRLLHANRRNRSAGHPRLCQLVASPWPRPLCVPSFFDRTRCRRCWMQHCRL